MPLIVLGTTHVFGEPRKQSIAVWFQLIGGGGLEQLVVTVTVLAGEHGHDCVMFIDCLTL